MGSPWSRMIARKARSRSDWSRGAVSVSSAIAAPGAGIPWGARVGGGGPVAARVAVDRGGDRRDVELVLTLAGLQGVDQAVVGKELREVEVGAGEGGDGDGVDHGCVRGVD